MSILKKANETFRNGNYQKAIELWGVVKREIPEMAFTISCNIELAKKRLLTDKKTGSSPIESLPSAGGLGSDLDVFPDSIGNIDFYSDGKVFGWAYCTTSTDEFLDIFLFIDNQFIASAKASIFREDLRRAGYGDGKRSFAIPIPKEFTDDQTHALEIRPGHYLKFQNGFYSKELLLRAPRERVVTLHERKQADSSSGRDAHSDRRVSVLLVAHNASDGLFGGELSFLDLAASIDRQKFKLIIALPKPNREYAERLISFADVIVSTRKCWWLKDSSLNEELVNDFQKIITEYTVELVYVNTIMLREPLVAADRQQVRSICHVREVIDRDEALLKAIGEPANTIIEKVKKRAEYLVVNSKFTHQVFHHDNRTFLVYNAVDVKKLHLEVLNPEIRPFRVGLLSSNLLKKGIADFVDLAKAAREKLPDIVFTLVGPDTPELTALKEELKYERIPPNIEFVGYVNEPRDALRSLHVVINFSHFAESFGRTIAEAMAAGRPVIAYDYGALPELIEHSETGYIVPYREPLNALEPLQELFEDPVLYRRMAEAARWRAVQNFSMDILKNKLNATINTVLDAKPAPADGVCELEEDLSVSVVIPNYNYSKYLPERINSILRQNHTPKEIIFLDDASSDDSVEVAKRLLSASGIPFRILVNESNAGIYSQWLKGIKESTGKWVWIAEADDSASPEFLSTLLTKDKDDVSLIYCQSKRIDSEGQVTAENNLHHTDGLSKTRWCKDYTAAGRDEIALGLGYRNCIPNVSAVLMRRSCLMDVDRGLSRFASCGDWWLYAHILKTGRISFISDSLNYFRRHANSQTVQKKSTSGYLDELSLIHSYISESFRLLPKEVDRFAEFVERDYKIDGYHSNLDYPFLEQTIRESKLRAQGRRRIAFITTNNGSWNGGSEVLWRDSASRLAEQGHDVVTLIRRWAPRPPFEDGFNNLGIRVFYKQYDGFARIVELQPDLVVISTGDQDEGGEYFPELIEKGIPFVIVNQLTKHPKYWRLREDKTPMLQNAYRTARLAFFTSINNMKLMENRLGFKLESGEIHFNPFHIDASEPIPLPPMDDGYRIAVPAKLLFVHKGQDILIPIFASEKWKGRDVTVHFYGEGPDGDLLAQQSQDAGIEKFQFHGRVEDIKDIWLNCHAILMPSRMEGMPIVLISAMVAGRVPVVTDIGGAAEVVTDEYNGFIAKFPEVAEVEDALERAWAHRADWEKFGLRARSSALSYLPEDPVGDFVKRIVGVAYSGHQK